MKEVTSAGGIVTKMGDGCIKLCLVELVHVNKGFIFPKGHVEAGENIQEAAIREVKEELGLKYVHAMKELGVVTRQGIERDGTEVIKNIHLYLMSTDGSLQTDAEEIYSWLTYDEALDKLEYDEEKAFLENHWDEITTVSNNSL